MNDSNTSPALAYAALMLSGIAVYPIDLPILPSVIHILTDD